MGSAVVPQVSCSECIGQCRERVRRVRWLLTFKYPKMWQRCPESPVDIGNLWWFTWQQKGLKIPICGTQVERDQWISNNVLLSSGNGELTRNVRFTDVRPFYGYGILENHGTYIDGNIGQMGRDGSNCDIVPGQVLPQAIPVWGSWPQDIIRTSKRSWRKRVLNRHIKMLEDYTSKLAFLASKSGLKDDSLRTFWHGDFMSAGVLDQSGSKSPPSFPVLNIAIYKVSPPGQLSLLLSYLNRGYGGCN